MKALSTLVITVALVVGLVGCEPAAATPTRYTVTISSTEGGHVTTPGEGVFIYDEGTVVHPVAEAEAGYRFINWTGDVDTFNTVNSPIPTFIVEDNYSITANFEPWDIEITNADDQNDYPACVESAGTYNITVKLRVNIPVGKTGILEVVASTETFIDPMPRTFVWFDPPTQHHWSVFGNGTHNAECNFVFSVPEVRRESWADMQVTATLFEGGEWRGADYRSCDPTVLPSAKSAIDVEFTGTVDSLDIFWGEFVIGAYIRIDEVTVEDPWSLLTPDETIYVGLEAAPDVQEVSIGAGDKVEICCDYHPDAGALVWRPQHHITRVQVFPWVWALVGLVVAAVVVYFAWWRRRSKSIKHAR